MKEIRLVADSSADVRSAGDHEIFVAPLKISTKDMSFTDDEALDVGAMVDHLSKYKGRSGTSCPNTEDWIAAFGGAERVIVCTITSNLSGSYNSACLAKAEYEAGDPERRVYVIDSLSTGPECALILRKLSELIDEGLEYEEIIDVINEYKASTGLLFMLKSMNNLANNGRVSHLAASVAKVIGISAIGKASDVGTLEMLAAFGGAERVIVCTITSNLSGSYNSACLAKAEYEAGDPERRVYVIDSLSTGPECALILRKLSELIDEGLEYEEIIDVINEYKASTGLLFMLKSMNNLANNGRVSHLAASVAKVIGISAIGKASDVGTLEMLHKCLGEARALATMFSELKEAGLRCGRVSIAHCQNEAAANKLSDMILKELPDCEVEIHTLGGLCSFYAERGGLLVGFEKR